MNLFLGKIDAGTSRERGIVTISNSLASANVTLNGNNPTSNPYYDYTSTISDIKLHSDFRLGELLVSKYYTYVFPSSTSMQTVTRVIDTVPGPGVIAGNVVPLIQNGDGSTFPYNIYNSTDGTRMLQFYINGSGYLVCRDVMIPTVDYSGVGHTLPALNTSFMVHYIKI